MKQRSYALLAAATGTVLALTACSSGGTSGSGGGEPLTDGTFKFALVADPGALNPLMTAASPAHALARLSYDYLLNPDPDTASPSRARRKMGRDNYFRVVHHSRRRHLYRRIRPDCSDCRRHRQLHHERRKQIRSPRGVRTGNCNCQRRPGNTDSDCYDSGALALPAPQSGADSDHVRGRVEGSDGGKQDDLRIGHVPDDRGSRQRSLLLRSARRIQLGDLTTPPPTLPECPRMSSRPS